MYHEKNHFYCRQKMIHLAREKASRENKPLNQVFRDWLKSYAGRDSSTKNYESLMKNLSYAEPGKRFSREEMNER
jgi:hypothetical protein